MNISSRIQSFKNAFVGIKLALASEINMKIHFIALFIVVVMGLLLDINSYEWIAIILISAMVISAELLNTAIEYFCNHVTPQIHPKIKLVKDISAGAVLIMAIAAVIIALIIFLPRIVDYL
jgi:diacylglycerol kinase